MTIDEFKLLNLSEQKRAVREYGFFRGAPSGGRPDVSFAIDDFYVELFHGFHMWVVAG